MKEIVDRLNEQRQIEVAKSILESNGYDVQRVDESWPPILNKLSKYDKNAIRNALLRANIDIENTPYEEIQITSNRDPRLKGENLLIFITDDEEIAVTFAGKKLVNPYDTRSRDVYYFLDNPWKTILTKSKAIYMIKFDQEIANTMKTKQQDRSKSKSGTVNRVRGGNLSRYDKSGYKLDPQKYQRMFAELNLNRAPEILQQAKEVYIKMAQNIDKDFGPDTGFYNYEYLMREILRGFKDVDRLYNKYAAEDDNWRKSELIEAIRDIKDTIIKSQKYLV